MQLNRFLLLSVSTAFGVGQAELVLGQIVPTTDAGTTGTTISLPVAQQGPNSQIDIGGGITAQGNLFHSFEQFSTAQGQTANFLVNPAIQNILTRVNGGNASIINGLMQVTGGNSNLYLMNPAGILFGPNASLNIPGSFLATTANGIQFGQNGWFSAVGANSYGGLIGNPSALGFTMANPGAIVNLASLKSKGDMGLVAGTIVNKGNLTASGNIVLTTVPGQKVVRLSQPGNLLSLELQNLPSEGLPISIVDVPTLITGGADTSSTIKLEKDANGNIILSGAGVDLKTGDIAASGIIKAGNSVQIKPITGNLLNKDGLVVLAGGNVEFLGDYAGDSLSVLAGGSVSLKDVKIQGVAKIENAISSDQASQLNSLAQITRADGSDVKINPTPIFINTDPNFKETKTDIAYDIQRTGGTLVKVNSVERQTLDIRAGIDWSKFGLFASTDLSKIVASSSAATIKIENIALPVARINGTSNSYNIIITSQYYPNNSIKKGNIEVATVKPDQAADYNPKNPNLFFVDSRSSIQVANMGTRNNDNFNVDLRAVDRLVTAGIESSLASNSKETSVNLQTDTGDIVVNGRISAGGYGLNIQAGGLFQILGSDKNESAYTIIRKPRVTNDVNAQQDVDVQVGRFLQERGLAVTENPSGTLFVNQLDEVPISIIARPSTGVEAGKPNAPVTIQYQGGKGGVVQNGNQRFIIPRGRAEVPLIEDRDQRGQVSVARIIIKRGDAALSIAPTEAIIPGAGAFVVQDSKTALGYRSITAEDTKSGGFRLVTNLKGGPINQLPADISGSVGGIIIGIGSDNAGPGGMAGVKSGPIQPTPTPTPILTPMPTPTSTSITAIVKPISTAEQQSKGDDSCSQNTTKSASQSASPCKKPDKENVPILKIEVTPATLTKIP